MSRGTQMREVIRTSPAAENWDVRSLHSDDENNDHKDFTATRGSDNSTSNAGKSGEARDKKNRRKSAGKPNHDGPQFTRKLWSVFKNKNSTPPGGRVTPIDSAEESGPRPVLKAFARKNSDNKRARSFESQKDRVRTTDVGDESDFATDERHTTHYSNPVYIPSLAEEEEDMERRGGVVSPGRSRRSYEAPIYSVNSAGRPVPITIEESECEGDEMDVEFRRHDDSEPASRRPSNESPTTPTASAIFARNLCCCQTALDKNSPQAAIQKAETLWRRTYRPDSRGIFIWLSVVTTAFLYNLWVIPLRATFSTEIQSSWKDIWFALDALCDLVFIVDIFVQFRTSYIQSGVFVTDIDQLNRYHRKKWTLAFDIIAIVPTDLIFIHTMNPYFRLNRVFKIHRVCQFYQRGELSTWSPNLWRTLNLLHLFFVSIHYNACIYYALSAANGFGTLLTSWSYPNPIFFPEYAPMYRRYTYSFYWCMVGLGLVNDRYFPETDWQFVYSIYLHFLGLIFLVVFIGFATALIVGKSSAKLEFEKTMQNAREYMRQRKLPKDIRSRVLRFYQYSWVSQQFPHLDDGSVLRHLPISVRQEIELHSNLTALKQIPSLTGCNSNILRDLVMRLRRSIYLPGQFVYKSGDLGTEMYIVGEGILQVVGDNDPTIYTLREGDVFGEIDLLNDVSKRRAADVVSYGYSELYVLSSNDIMDTFRKYPKFMNLVQQQEKRNRVMTSNARERKAFGARYQGVPSASVKSAAESKISVSKVHFQMSNGDVAGLQGSSPDSGVPSSRSMEHSSMSESPSAIQQDPIKADLAEKISTLYQDHMKTLKASLDGVWYREISYLHQRLEDTEVERDMKAREIARLRRQVSNGNVAKNSKPNNGNITNSNRKPGQSELVISGAQKDETQVNNSDNSQRKVIRSVKERANAFEAGIQQFGSSSSIGET